MIKSKKFNILFTSGGFDILHAGHIANLEEIKSRCSKLIVGVSSDELLKSYKYTPPIVPLKQRMRMIAALRCVDTVMIQKEFMDIQMFIESKADKFALWTGWKDNPKIPEWYIKNDKMLWIPYNYGLSSTKIKERIIKQSYKIIRSQLQRELKQENQK
jgi:cytidyltransferase-like protein